MVLPTLVRQALSCEPLTVFGDGTQRRCFGYVGDAVEALIRIAQCRTSAGEVFNVGNDQEICINELAELIRKRTGSSSEIVNVPYHIAYGPGFEDMHRRVPSLEKLESHIGFRPSTPVERIVDIVLAVQQKNRATAAVA
jgi:UDP-glucose 4-epimerase